MIYIQHKNDNETGLLKNWYSKKTHGFSPVMFGTKSPLLFDEVSVVIIEKKIKTIAGNALRTVRAWKSRHEINKLLSHKSPKLKAIGLALSETLDNKISHEEYQFISLIENRRESLLRSDNIIRTIDYGAGNPHSNRTNDEMMRGIVGTAPVSNICKASKSAFWALFLFKLIRKLRPDSCIELGTCVGISAAYQAAALIINNKGKLVTLEGSPEIAQIAKDTLEVIGLENVKVIIGPFYDTYTDTLESAKPVDFLFNDGHHDYNAVLKNFIDALPYLADEAIMVFDDISWSPSMKKAWSEIENDTRVDATISFGVMGIAVLSNKKTAKNTFSIPL